MLRYDLRLLIIELGQLTSGCSLDSQQLVELRVNGLRVTMFRPLNEQRHQPRGDGCHRLPVKTLWIENQPGADVAGQDEEGSRMCHEHPQPRQRGGDLANHHLTSIPEQK